MSHEEHEGEPEWGVVEEKDGDLWEDKEWGFAEDKSELIGYSKYKQHEQHMREAIKTFRRIRV